VRTVRASSGRTSFRPSRGGAEGGLAVSLQVQRYMGHRQFTLAYISGTRKAGVWRY
jgi:hypothetical protein